MPQVRRAAAAARTRASPLAVKVPRREKSIAWPQPPPGTAYLYTDGSHIKGTWRLGWGAALFYGVRRFLISGVPDPAVDSRDISNPTMELRAAAAGLERLCQVRPPELARVKVLADYIGVYHYGIGEWHASNAKVVHFRQEAQRLERAIEAVRAAGLALEFCHVRGHQGDAGNTLADALARSCTTRDDFGRIASPLPDDDGDHSYGTDGAIGLGGQWFH